MQKIIISFLLFLLSFFLIGQNLNKPFWGEHDWNGVRYGNIARNYLKHGFINLKFAQIENSGLVSKDQFEFFTHYPPLLPILISLNLLVFGISEWSIRLIPLLATSITITIIFLIGYKIKNISLGILASLFALVTPMVNYFGKLPSHEPLVLFFVTLSFLFFLYYRDSKNNNWKILLIVSLIFAHLSTWAGFFLLPAIIITDFIQNKFRTNLLPFLFIPISTFAFYLFFNYIITNSFFGGDLIGVFLQRTSLEKNIQPQGLNLFNYLNQIRVWMSSLYSLTLMLLSIIWILLKLFRGLSKSDWDILTLGIFGIIYLLIFPNAAFIHNYLVIYLLPFIVISSASVIFLIRDKKLVKIISVAFLILIFFEGRDYLDALNKSHGDELAVRVGKAINQESNNDDTILISPKEFSYSADKFLRFYSDRSLIYSEDLNYDVKVIIDQYNQKFEIIYK